MNRIKPPLITYMSSIALNRMPRVSPLSRRVSLVFVSPDGHSTGSDTSDALSRSDCAGSRRTRDATPSWRHQQGTPGGSIDTQRSSADGGSGDHGHSLYWRVRWRYPSLVCRSSYCIRLHRKTLFYDGYTRSLYLLLPVNKNFLA